MRLRGFLPAFLVAMILFPVRLPARGQQKETTVPPAQVDQAQSLAKKVYEDGIKLAGLFKEKGCGQMAKFLDSLHAVLITPDYEIIYGKDSAAFWEKMWSPGAFLVFEPLNFHFSSALGVKTTKEGTMNSAAFVAQRVGVVSKGEKEAVAHNQSVLLIMPGKHRNDCQWY
jgi:hypothetical protein